MLGYARFGVVDVGACLAVQGQIEDGDGASWATAMTAAGDHYAATADAAAAAGHRASARDMYFQSSSFTFAATYTVDLAGASSRFGPLWKRQQAVWDQGAALLDTPVEHVQIAYQDTSAHAQVPHNATTLPGYFFKVDDSGDKRPLLIFNNGSDGAMHFAWASAIAPALERGYNCLTFYGPGQGLALVDQSLYFRPDWEQVITPVVDYALTRADVDPARIALMGGSQAGYWVPRALAFEHRIAAGVADPGVWDVSTSWLGNLPAPLVQLLDAGNKSEFDQAMQEGLANSPLAATQVFRSRPYGFSSAFDTFSAVRQYALTGELVAQIGCPLLITDPEGEQFWPGQSKQLYDALPGQKLLVPFTRAEGADLHCEPMAPGLRAQRVFDWLDATLG